MGEYLGKDTEHESKLKSYKSVPGTTKAQREIRVRTFQRQQNNNQSERLVGSSSRHPLTPPFHNINTRGEYRDWWWWWWWIIVQGSRSLIGIGICYLVTCYFDQWRGIGPDIKASNLNHGVHGDHGPVRKLPDYGVVRIKSHNHERHFFIGYGRGALTEHRVIV